MGGVVGCTKRPPTKDLVQVPTQADDPQQAKCKVGKSVDKPLIVEWPSGERAELESSMSRGPVVVAYDGCEMRLLSHCRVAGEYSYVPINPKLDTLRIRDDDALWANMPLGAAKLEATLARAGQLEVATNMVGR